MKDIEFKELQRKEAIKRLEELERLLGLKSKVLNDFKLGKISISLFNRVIETQRVKNLDKMIAEFEKENNALVYHCIGCPALDKIVILLYVDKIPNPDNLDCMDIVNDFGEDGIGIFGFCINLTQNRYISIGLAFLTSNNGVLELRKWGC